MTWSYVVVSRPSLYHLPVRPPTHTARRARRPSPCQKPRTRRTRRARRRKRRPARTRPRRTSASFGAALSGDGGQIMVVTRIRPELPEWLISFRATSPPAGSPPSLPPSPGGCLSARGSLPGSLPPGGLPRPVCAGEAACVRGVACSATIVPIASAQDPSRLNSGRQFHEDHDLKQSHLVPTPYVAFTSLHFTSLHKTELRI